MHDTMSGPADRRSRRTAVPGTSSAALDVAEHEPANKSGGFIRVVAPPPSLSGVVDLIVMVVAPANVARQLRLARFPHVSAQVVFAIAQGRSLPGGRPTGTGHWASLLVVPAHLHLAPLRATVTQMVSVALHPTGLRLIATPGTAQLVGSRVVPLHALWGDAADDLLEQLINQRSLQGRLLKLVRSLEARLPVVALPHAIARQATELLLRTRGAIRIDALATSCRCTLRTLHTVLVAETGLRPKHFARILRLRHAVDLLAAGSGLNEAAAHAAYADQPHMTREFRVLFHQSPRSVVRTLRAARQPDFPLALPAHRPITDTGVLIARRRRAHN